MSRPRAWALARASRVACVKETPSRTNETASTTYATTKSVAGSGCSSSEMPWLIDTTAPAVNRPKAANIDQTYASRP